jgi:hypothetical protein
MKSILSILFIAAFAFSSCNYVNGERVRGNGDVKTEERQAANFSSISSHGGFDVHLTQGSGYSVKIEAESNLLPYIESVVNGDVLELRTKEGYWLKSKKDIKVYITAPSFTKVSTHGSGDIISESKLNNTSPIEMEVAGSGDIKVDINAPEVKAELRGSGNIILNGETRAFRGAIEGSGDIKASNLKAENVDVDITGSGGADVYASVKLNVDVKGSGDVRYRGGANVSSDIKGSGSVKKVD